MNIVIITLGTRGDVQPYIALGQGLKARGHRVTLCTCLSFKQEIDKNGLDYGYINNQMIDFIHSDVGKRLIEQTTSVFALMKVYFQMANKIKPMQQATIDDSWFATKRAKPDLILFHPKAVGAIHFADKLHIPAVLTLLQPMAVPTKAFACAVFKPKNLGGWYNKLTYTFMLRLSALGTRKLTSDWRRANGLSSDHQSTSLLHDCSGDLIPVLHGYSEHVVPRPKDWPDHAKTTGYWVGSSSKNWQPPEELLAFINQSESQTLVYAGFGSMAGTSATRLGELILQALQKAKVRAVIASGWGGIDIDQCPDHVLLIEQAPHDWLFPRMDVVIHHGGAGTTASAIRAGCAQIICPFCVDQPFWGEQIHKLGLGVKPIKQKSLTVGKLVHAIRVVTNKQSIIDKVNQYQQKLAQEDGVANAVRYIEQSQRTDKHM